MNKLTLSLGQMDVHLGDPERNWAQVSAWTAEAARRGSDLVIFPELWSTGYALDQAASFASPLGQGVWRRLDGLAAEQGVHLVGSCLADLGEGRYGNTAVWHTPHGTPLGHYSKIHLFQLMDEHHYLTAGDSPTLLDTPFGPIGLAICYDLRFPELFRHYALRGAKIIILPAEWPHPRLTHWLTLLRARAIENQLYIVACNRVGESKGTRFFGHSCVIDPWGEVQIMGGEQEMLLTAVLDLDLVDEVRQKIPVFADRRPTLY